MGHKIQRMEDFKEYKEKYLVSKNGEVFKKESGKITLKKLYKDNYGYLVTSINGKNEKVHRIVMAAFIGKSNLTVDHLDGNKINNNLNNLEYVTRKENANRANKSLANNNGKVVWNNKTYNSATELSLELGLNKSACSIAINKKCRLRGHYPVYEKNTKNDRL